MARWNTVKRPRFSRKSGTCRTDASAPLASWSGHYLLHSRCGVVGLVLDHGGGVENPGRGMPRVAILEVF